MTRSTTASRLSLQIAGALMVAMGFVVGTAGTRAQQPAATPLQPSSAGTGTPAAAQGASAAGACRVTGTIGGLNMPLPGVAITARRGQTVQGATSTDLNGAFALTLPDGTYQITIDLTGFERVDRELAVSRDACPPAVEALLTLVPRTSPVSGPAAGALAAGRGRGAGPAAAVVPADAGAPGRFEALEVTQEADIAGLDADAFGLQESDTFDLLPPGFGSEAVADAIAITGDSASVDRRMLNDRLDAIRRGELDVPFDPEQFRRDGFGGGNTPSIGGRGGRGGEGFLGGRGFRGNRGFQATVNYGFSGSALNAAQKQLRSEVAGTERPFSNHNFSTSLGFPLKIPGLYANENGSSNVTLSFSGSRGGNLFDQYATVPTDAMRAGDFSSSSVQLVDPLTGTSFQNNQIPADRMSPQALALLQYYPAPNLSGDTRNYHYATSTSTTQNQVQVRFQHNFSGQASGRGGRGGAARQSNAGQAGRGQRLLGTRTNVNMNLNVSFNQNDGDQLNVFTTLGGQRESRTYGIQNSFNIQRGRTQHQVSVNYNRSRTATTNRFSGVTDVSGLIGIQGVSDDSFAWGLPRLSFSSITGLNDVTPSLQAADRINTTYSLRRSVRGNHSLRAGGEFQYDVTTTNTESNANGSFVFTGLYSSGGGQLGGLTYADFADFLLGLPQQASIQYGPGETTLTGRDLAVYIEDDWRPAGNLSFQFGLRYALQWPFVEENGQLVNLDVTPDFTAAAPVTAGQAGAYSGAFPAALIQTDTDNLMPKIAAAWRGPSETIFNGSYEVNYNSGTYSGIARQLAQQPPFATTGTAIGSLSSALLMESVLATGIPADETRNNYGVDKDYVLGLVQSSTLNVRRELGRSWQASATYTHTRGSNLEIVRAPNRDAGGLRIDGVQPFTWTTAEGRSVLNAVNLGLQKRASNGVSYGVEYTLAKSRDNSPSIGGGGGGGGNVAQNDRDIEAEWGASNFDQRHQVSVNFRGELPFGEDKRWLNNGGFAASLLNDWSFQLQFSARSGRPRSVTVRGASRDIATGINGALRADYTGAPVDIEDPSVDRWFNTDAFMIPASGLFGSSPRNIIYGPGSKDLNGSIQRTLRIGGNRQVQVRMQVRNLLNMANYTGIDTNVNSPTFGQITGVSGSRSATLNLGFRF